MQLEDKQAKNTMSLTICSTKIASNTTQHLQGTKLGPNIPSTGRREILLSSTTCIFAAAIALDQDTDSKTALLQKYLKKSQENKTKNDKERLDDYYKRNYKDYFGLLEGSLRAKEDGQLSKSDKAILEWLDKNK